MNVDTKQRELKRSLTVVLIALSIVGVLAHGVATKITAHENGSRLVLPSIMSQYEGYSNDS